MFLPSLRYKYSQLVNLASRQFHLSSAVLGGAGYEETGYDKVKTDTVIPPLSLS